MWVVVTASGAGTHSSREEITNGGKVFGGFNKLARRWGGGPLCGCWLRELVSRFGTERVEVRDNILLQV